MKCKNANKYTNYWQDAFMIDLVNDPRPRLSLLFLLEMPLLRPPNNITMFPSQLLSLHFSSKSLYSRRLNIKLKHDDENVDLTLQDYFLLSCFYTDTMKKFYTDPASIQVTRCLPQRCLRTSTERPIAHQQTWKLSWQLMVPALQGEYYFVLLAC